MDWQVLISAVGGAGVVAIAIGLLLRRSLEKLLDLKLKEIEERHKVQLAELTRRQAAIFDEQLNPLRTLLATLYRLRNAAHTLGKAKWEERLEHRNEVVRLASEVAQLIIEHKAILPQEIWRVGHTAKGSTAMIFGSKLIKPSTSTNIPTQQEAADAYLAEVDTEVFKAYLIEIEGLYQQASHLTLDYLNVQ